MSENEARIQELKATIFDVLRAMETAQGAIRALDARRMELLKELDALQNPPATEAQEE